MYKVVIFDFFGLFCPDITLEWFTKTVPDYQTKFAAYRALCTESDYGRLTRAAFNQKLADLVGLPVDQVTSGIEEETRVNTALVQYVTGLKQQGYRIACLSNGTQEWTTRVIEASGLSDLFEILVLSGELGVIKPSPEIYTATLQQLNVKASEAVFVDDREVNVRGAEACGIRSLLFTNTDSFIRDFEALI